MPGGVEVEQCHRGVDARGVDAVQAESRNDPGGLDGCADIERKIEGDVVHVLCQSHVRVIRKARLVVEGAGADLLGEVRAVGGAFGQRHEGDVGDGAEGIGARQGDAEGGVSRGDGAQVIDDFGASLACDGGRRHERDVRGDARSRKVSQAKAQVGELCDPRFGNCDDDAEPVLAGESLGEEHGACLCRGCGGSTVPGVGVPAMRP